jgi:hypothetical protein
MPKTSNISIFRSNDVWMDRNRVYKVLIDGEVSGELWPDKSETFRVRPGEHRVQVRIDFMKSNEFSTSIEDGQSLELQCSGKGSAMALFNTLFRRNAYLTLRPF